MTTAPNVRIIPANKTPENAENRKLLRVAAYCRVSTELEEQQNSYQVQIAYYSDLIQKNNDWQLAGIFADEGLTGTCTKKRTEFNRMIRLCKAKKIDLIICKSTSRFARNTVDCLQYVRLLKSLGIGVIFEKENINTLTMNSEFILTLYGSFAQAESESISKNVSLGVQMAFREGRVRYAYGNWLGYKKGEDGKPEIVPDEAKTIRMIYAMFMDGLSTQTIADMLTEAERKNAHGEVNWRHDSVTRILKNEKYAGDALLQKTYTLDCMSHKSVKNKGERTMYYVRDCHPAIIERELFNQVQQELARRNAKRKKSAKTTTEQGKYSSKYALSELMVCGECGTPFRRCTWNVHGKKRIVWRCISRLDHGSRYCKNSPTLHETKLHEGIVKAVNEYFDCTDELERILQICTEQVLHETDDSARITRRLAEIDSERNALVEQIVSGSVNSDALDEQFHDLYTEEEQLAALLASYESNNHNENALQDILLQIQNADKKLIVFDDIFIRKILDCVRVTDKTHVQITFKGGGEITAELEA